VEKVVSAYRHDLVKKKSEKEDLDGTAGGKEMGRGHDLEKEEVSGC